MSLLEEYLYPLQCFEIDKKAIHEKRDPYAGEIWTQLIFYTGVATGVEVIERVGSNGTDYDRLHPWTADVFLNNQFLGNFPTHLIFGGPRIEVYDFILPSDKSRAGKNTLKIFFPADESYATTEIFVCYEDGKGCEPHLGIEYEIHAFGHVDPLTTITGPTGYREIIVGDGFPVDPITGTANGEAWIDRKCAKATPNCVETGTMVQTLVFENFQEPSGLGQFRGVRLTAEVLGPSPRKFQIYVEDNLVIEIPIKLAPS